MEKKVRFNESIAAEVFTVLDRYYREKKGVLISAGLPEDNYPPKEANLSEKEIVDFFFYTALTMRGGMVSDSPFKLLWSLREKNPGMFNPEIVIAHWSMEKIRKTFTETGFLYKNWEIPKCWYQNSVNLCQWWGGDVRNVFKYGVSEFEEAFRRIDYEKSKVGFYGMRRKIFSLLTIWLQEKGLIPIFPTPIPVDFHAMRILWATEIVDAGKLARPFTPKPQHPEQIRGKTAISINFTGTGFPDQIAIWSQKFLQKIDISHMTINPILWILSRSLCAGQFQNITKDDAKTYVETDDLQKNSNLWPKNYQDPCHVCPIEKWCKWSIPAAPYYRWGLLLKIGKRVSYPQKYLAGFENINHKHRKKNRGAN